MDRLSMMRGNGFAWGALLVCALSASACGDPSCPGGSISINGRCEPAVEGCPEGQVENAAGKCLNDSTNDAGLDGNVSSEDAAVDETGSIDSSVTDAAGSDSEVMMPLPSLCEDVECGDHGTCMVVDDEPVCECDDGYAGELCDACEQGKVLDDDACVLPCEAQDAPICGEHGECVAPTDFASCNCDHPYEGDECAECAEGFALQPDGTCEPDCGVCGAHAFCNADQMTPACECVAGYEIVGSGCTWVGDGETAGFLNGDLATGEGWIPESVTISGGRATFENERVDGACRVGTLAQTITMPSRADAEQLVMDIDLVTSCAQTNDENCPALQLEIGATVSRLTLAGGASPVADTVSACLGDAAYGGDVAVKIRPGLAYSNGSQAFECDDVQWPQVDAVRIRPAAAGECPNPGLALGSLSSSAGWKGTSTFSGGQISALSGPIDTFVHVPAGAGLAVQASGTNAIVLVEGLDRSYLISGSTVHCLPSWTQGSVTRVGFRPIFGGAKVTAFSITTDPSCGNTAFDRGFERVDASRSWDASPASALAINANAYEGERVLRATNAAVEALALVRLADVNAAMGGIGFASRRRVVVPSAAAVLGTYTIDFGEARTATTTSSAWSSLDLTCLDPAWALQLISVHMRASAQLTSGTGTPQVLLDDVGPVVTDSCN